MLCVHTFKILLTCFFVVETVRTVVVGFRLVFLTFLTVVAFFVVVSLSLTLLPIGFLDLVGFFLRLGR